MKTIILVTFLGILTYACYTPKEFSQGCRKPPMENFNLTKYLQISEAYATHSTNEGEEFTIFCRVRTTSLSSDGTVVIITDGYYQHSEGEFYSKHQCNAPMEEAEKGHFSSECKVIEGYLFEVNTEVHKVYMSVIDTDYSTYAILHRCMEIESRISVAGTTLVLQTDKNATDDKVKEALKNIGMNFNIFTPRNKNYCDNIIN